jgi:HAD superfamily hydrolase (TIGR01458 family)
MTKFPETIAGLLLDLDGVVYVGDRLLPGAREAIERLRAGGIRHKFITNTTRRSRDQVAEKLLQLGLEVDSADIFTPAALAAGFLRSRRLAPFLVACPDLRADFVDVDGGDGEAVVVGDAGVFFSYDLMNAAYRRLLDGAEFVALAKNRSFRDHDGGLSLDAGPFVAALEFATGREARLFGKPSEDFFRQAAAGVGCPVGRIAMIGDDVDTDVAGGMAAGLAGVLVQTGKYVPGQETRIPPGPSRVVRDLAAAVDMLFA